MALLLSLGSLAHDVALLGDPPAGHWHTWVEQWLGTYVQTPLEVNGRPTFAKAGDAGKVMWSLPSGEWRIGREQDTQTGWGLFMARGDYALPDQIGADRWQIASQGRGWTDAPKLACLPAPPPTVWLFGHAPSSGWIGRGWVTTWTGAYELQPSLINGRPVYGRAGDASQRLWFARSDSYEPFWFFGPASGVGSSRGWLSVQDSALAPHRIGATWRMASAEDEVAWVRAPGLRVAANASHVVGWYRSRVAEGASPAVSAVALRAMLLAADAADGALAAADRARAWLRAHPLAPHAHALRERAAEYARELRSELRALSGHERLAEARFTWAFVLASLLLWAALMGFMRRRLLQRSEEVEYEVDDGEGDVESSEEKRLAFACLSGAIEDVRDLVSEQQ